MKRVACLVVAVAACSRTGKLIGEKLEADVPAGWRLAGALSAEVGSAFPEVPPVPESLPSKHALHRHVLVRDAQPERLPAIALYEIIDTRAVEPKLSAPQANLMGTVSSGVVVPRPTVETCRAVAERFGLQAAEVAVIDRDGIQGCDLQLTGGLRRAVVIWVDGALALVTCQRASARDPDLDRACDRVVGSLRATSPPSHPR